MSRLAQRRNEFRDLGLSYCTPDEQVTGFKDDLNTIHNSIFLLNKGTIILIPVK